MKSVVAALVLLGAPVADSAVVRGSTFLAADDGEHMRPEVVANTLARVEDEWKEQATAFTECNSAQEDCNEAHKSFDRSCATVVSAVVQGSGGDRNVAKEYMTNVCAQKNMAGWHKLRCTDLASAIVDHGMSADKYSNRESFKPTKLCTAFWSKFVDEERKREAEEAKEKAELEKKEALAAAEAKKKAEADAKVAAERKAKEEQELKVKQEKEAKELKAKQEADKVKKDAEEAKARFAESAARLAKKKEEAAAVQKAAQEKLKEAEEAEKEHVKLQAEHKQAEESLSKATLVAKPIDAKSTKPEQPAVKLAAKAVPKEPTKEAVVAPPAKVVAAPAAKVAAPAPKVVTPPVKAATATAKAK